MPYYRIDFNTWTISVYNGYTVREQLKRLGFTFNKRKRSWQLVAETLDNAKKVLQSLDLLDIQSDLVWETRVKKYVEFINKKK